MKCRWKLIVWLGTAACSGLAPQAASSQIFTPTFLAPVQASEVGVYLTGGFGPSGGLALEAIRRRGHGAFDLGFRAGVGDSDGGAVILLGADYRNPLEVEFAPLIVATTGGAQLAVGDGAGFGLDAGVSVGSTFASGDLLFTPYLNPRLALVETLRSEGGLDLAVLADLGVDLQFAPTLTGRLALGLGGPTANFSLGLAWR